MRALIWGPGKIWLDVNFACFRVNYTAGIYWSFEVYRQQKHSKHTQYDVDTAMAMQERQKKLHDIIMPAVHESKYPSELKKASVSSLADKKLLSLL
jgi:hypothetical protein